MDEIDERCKELLYLKQEIGDDRRRCERRKAELAALLKELGESENYYNEAVKHTINIIDEEKASDVGFVSAIVDGVEFKTVQGREVVVIEDEKLLPDHYLKPKISSTIDKVRLLKDLKAGKQIPGAKKVRNENYLDMKVLL